MGKYKTLLVNIGIFGLNVFATKLIAFFLVPLYTSHMTPVQYGVADMAQTTQNLITPVLTLSIADAVLRFSVEGVENRHKYIGFGLYITLASCVLACILLPMLNLSVFGGLGNYKILFLMVYCAGAFQTLYSSVARSYGHLRLMAVSSIISSLVTCYLSVDLIVYKGMGVSGYLLALFVGSLVAITTYIAIGGIEGYLVVPMRSLQIGKHDLQDLLSYSIPLVPNSVFWWAGMGVSRFFITGSLGVAYSGLYAAASKLPNLINSIYSIFQQAWTLSAFQEIKNEGVEDFYSKVFKLLQLLLVVVCQILICGAPFLAHWILKDKFYVGWVYIPIVSIGVFLNCLSSFYGSVFTSSKQTGYLMKTTFVGALTCVVFSAFLTPELGVAGAALSMVACNASVFLMRAYEARTVLPFEVNWKLLIATIAFLLMQGLIPLIIDSGWAVVMLSAVIGVIMASLHLVVCKPLILAMLKRR